MIRLLTTMKFVKNNESRDINCFISRNNLHLETAKVLSIFLGPIYFKRIYFIASSFTKKNLTLVELEVLFIIFLFSRNWSVSTMHFMSKNDSVKDENLVIEIEEAQYNWNMINHMEREICHLNEYVPILTSNSP